MPVDLPEYAGLVHTAVASYWNVRRSQAERSRAQGVLTRGRAQKSPAAGISTISRPCWSVSSSTQGSRLT